MIFLWALLQLLLCTTVHGQVVLGDRHSGTFRRAVNAADQGDYQTARDLLGNILKDNPLHMDALTQLGVVFMETNQQLDSAQALFNRVLAQVPEEDLYDPFSVYLHQLKARTYNLQLQPRKALAMLEVVKDSIALDDLRAEVQQEFQHTNNAILLLDNPIQLNIRDVGKNINSEYDDHSPLVDLSGRRMYFTSRRASGNDRLLPDDQYFENIYVAEHDGRTWQKPRLVESLYNRNEHMSLLSLSPDGSQLFLYQSDGKVTRNLSVSRLINGIWQTPELLPAPINSYYDETHASLSPDQSTLYFTSNRPGGYGGLDIWAVRKDAYGQWGEPWNLGPAINTAGDEESPMMHPDGTTLYYISNGPHSMGGFDVLYSQLQTDSTWARAVNMGYPVNTPDDDLFFLPTLDKSEAYLTSFRFNEEEGRSDIYNVNFEGAGCRNCRDRRGCLYLANPCPAKAKTGQYPVSGGTRHQHAEKQSRQGRLSALLPGRLCYSGGGRSLFAANEKGSPLPRCFYAPPGGVGRAEALKKTGSAFPTSQEGKSTGQK